MDTERESRPKPPPRQKGPGGRVETKFHLVTRCNNCSAEIQVKDQIQVTDKCTQCGTDLHTCRNCLNFDPSARNECVKAVAVRVTNKSANKIWAAKFTARHPNLVAVELSNFKCGHDAPIYATIEKIIETSGTPYFAFKDIDENKPTGSIKLRVETIDYFLKRYRRELKEKKQ